MLLGGLLTLAFVGYGCAALVALMARQHLSAEQHFATGALTAVDLETSGIGITVAGGLRPGAQATLSYRFSWSWERPRLTATRGDDGTLRIALRCRDSWAPIGCSGQLRLAVPTGVAITATTSGGGIVAQGIVGDVRLESSGGGIRATGLRANRVDAGSSGGRIDLAFAASPTSVRARSDGGGIVIKVPDGSGPYAVDSAASGGESKYEIKSDSRAPRTVYARSSGGGIHIRYTGG